MTADDFDPVAWHDRHVAAARDAAVPLFGRRGDARTLHRPSVDQMREELARPEWRWGPPESDELTTAGEWEDAVALRCHEHDPDADIPHPGGPRWERLMRGEAG